jgi:CxxC-x17-CxxC domain-containing protein
MWIREGVFREIPVVTNPYFFLMLCSRHNIKKKKFKVKCANCGQMININFDPSETTKKVVCWDCYYMLKY